MSTHVAEKEAISRPHLRRGNGRGCLFVFFGLFFVVGLAFFYFTLLRPAYRLYQSRSWPSTECTVVSSKLDSFTDDDGTSYRINIGYRYEVEGAEYQSNQYDFIEMSSSGRKGKQQVVRQHPAGSKTICYYNPDAPEDAVLSREMRPEMLFGLVPLIFVVIGGGGLAYLLLKPTGPRHAAGELVAGRHDATTPTAASSAFRSFSGPAATYDELNGHGDGPVLLKPAQSPISKFVGLLFVGIFWNGIVGVFLYFVVDGFRRGEPFWFMALFLIPFLLIGMILIVGIVQSFLQLFNPRPRLTVENGGKLVLGQSTQVRWEMEGRVSSIRRLDISLVGEEKARYTRGTSTYTDEEVFYEQTLGTCENPREMGAGSVTLTLPADSMHSFDGGHNQIVWSLRVAGEIAFWPDVDEKFMIHVRPHPIQQVTSQFGHPVH